MRGQGGRGSGPSPPPLPTFPGPHQNPIINLRLRDTRSSSQKASYHRPPHSLINSNEIFITAKLGLNVSGRLREEPNHHKLYYVREPWRCTVTNYRWNWLTRSLCTRIHNTHTQVRQKGEKVLEEAVKSILKCVVCDCCFTSEYRPTPSF